MLIRVNRFALLCTIFLTIPAAPLAAQDLSAVLDARADRVPEAKGAFQETWLLPRSGDVAAEPGDTDFGARVAVRHDEGRERIEIRRAAGGALSDPVVVVGDEDGYWLVTAVGATPLAETEPARDPLVRRVLEGPPGQAPPHRTVPAPGGIAAVVLRHPLSDDFDDDAFAVRGAPLSAGRLGAGISSFREGGDRQAVASAGARGVERVRTANGEVQVEPDPAAVEWMDGAAPSAVEAETFKREAGLAPYDALPPAEAPAGDADPAEEAP